MGGRSVGEDARPELALQKSNVVVPVIELLLNRNLDDSLNLKKKEFIFF